MTNRFRLASRTPRRLTELGVVPATLLRHANLSPNLFAGEKILLTTDELFAIYTAIGELSDNPRVGLLIGEEDGAEMYDPVTIAALCTRSCREALARLARYKQLTCPEAVEIVETDEECTVHFNWLLAERAEPPLLVDACFAKVVSVARKGMGKQLIPKRIELMRSPHNRDVYESYFGCPVIFEAARNVLVLHKADVEAPFLTHNSDLLAMVAPQLEAELSMQLKGRTTGEQVKNVLKRLLAGHRPGLDDVARELHLSTRTLQRRLTGEGVTFQQLTKEARRELAQHYLLHSCLELNETAYLLGYEDANSFFRAFQHWEGTSPGEWRSTHLLDPGPVGYGKAADAHAS